MRFFKFLLVLVVIVGGVLAYWLLVPAGPSVETFVDIPSGTGSEAMAEQLQKAGVIRSQYGFELMRVVKGGRLAAGVYRFDHPVPMAEVYQRRVKGDVFTRTVVIPEGFNLFDVGAAMEAAKLGTREQFLEAARKHTELVVAWSPEAKSVEGFLFPDTYRFSPHASEEQMLRVMVKRFGVEAAKIGLVAGKVDVAKTVTMASLVEREVSVDSERPMVAGVFVNRLKLGMPLQTDPAVVYAALLNGRWRGTIYQSDLQYDSPYNTYKNKGLPPGPICNPGMAALKAAMAPVETENLYFVADANGRTKFSPTLAGHVANVESYKKAGGR